MDPYYFDTVVVGVGNTVLSGTATGARAARVLMRDKRLRPDIAVVVGGGLGLDLLGSIADARHVLFLDAVDFGAAAGTVVRLSAEELLDTARESSVHHLGIADLMTVLTLVSSNIPEVVLLGLQAPRMEWGRSRAMKTAVASLVDEAVNQLRVWHSETLSAPRCLSARS